MKIKNNKIEKLHTVCKLYPQIDQDEIVVKLKNALFPTDERINFIEPKDYKINDLIESINNTDRDLIYIIGGIGVGKTKFLKYFIEKNKNDNNNNPIVEPIYIDCAEILKTLSPLEFDIEFNELLSGMIQTRIDGFYPLSEQINSIWNKHINPIKNNQTTSPNKPFLEIYRKIKDSDNDILRQNIYNDIIRDTKKAGYYYKKMVRHLIEDKFKGKPNKFFVIIDNLDQHSEGNLDNIKTNLLCYSTNSGAKYIVACRRSTYKNKLYRCSTDIIGKVNYKVLTPMEYLNSRIDDFISAPGKYSEFKEDKERIINSLNGLKSFINKDRHFEDIHDSICGHSIRKAVLSCNNNLISNHAYNFFDLNKDTVDDENNRRFKLYDVIRGYLIGSNDYFKYDLQSPFENIFELEDSNFNNHLIKSRILKIINTAGTMNEFSQPQFNLKELIEILQKFYYKANYEIYLAFDQLMNKDKRLVWNDDITIFKDENDILKHDSSYCIITNSGTKYIDKLFVNLNYVQEMILDTRVHRDFKNDEYDVLKCETSKLIYPNRYPYGYFHTHYNLTDPIDRIRLLYHFIKYIVSIDVVETNIFINNDDRRYDDEGIDEYYKIFRTYELLTHDFVQGNLDTLRVLLDVLCKRAEPDDKHPDGKHIIEKFKREIIRGLQKLRDFTSDIHNLRNLRKL